MHLLFWMIGGIAVGWLSQRVQGYKQNRTMNLVMGAAGGGAGGLFVVVSPLFAYGGMIFADLGAVVGAVVLIFLSRHVGASRQYDATMVRKNFRTNRQNSPRVPGLMQPEVAYARIRKENM